MADFFNPIISQNKDDDIEIAKLLLEYVQNPDIKNKALLNAVKNSQLEMVILLLDNDADPNTIDIYDKDTPLMYAIINKNSAKLTTNRMI